MTDGPVHAFTTENSTGLTDTTVACSTTPAAASPTNCIDDEDHSLLCFDVPPTSTAEPKRSSSASPAGERRGGDLRLTVDTPADLARPRPNDECANAIPLALGVPVIQGTTINSTQAPTSPTPAAAATAPDICPVFDSPRPRAKTTTSGSFDNSDRQHTSRFILNAAEVRARSCTI